MISLTIVMFLCMLLQISKGATISSNEDNTEVVQKLCPFGCPKIMLPVCGFDGENYRTFHNDCMLKMKKCEEGKDWRIIDMDECDKYFRNEEKSHVNKYNCVKPCPYIFLPVCAHDGERYQIFGNQCHFEVANCFNHNAWKRVSPTECEPIQWVV